MKKKAIYLNDWLEYHAYTRQATSDAYYIKLANRFFEICDNTPIGKNLLEEIKKKLCCRLAAYFEDLISESGLWINFIHKNKELYGKYLPFYPVNENYVAGEPNPEDIQFLVWHYVQLYLKTSFVDPNDNDFCEFSRQVYQIMDEEYETAPANEELTGAYDEETLFTVSYLYSPGNEFAIRKTMQEVAELTKGQPHERKSSLLAKRLRETIEYTPCIPLALYADEWENIINQNSEAELPEEQEEEMKEMIKKDYQTFCKANNNDPLAYFQSSNDTYDFFVNALGWDKEELPDLGDDCQNVVLFSNPEKGLLIATNINPCIKDEKNPLYDKEEARQFGASLFMTQGVCPIDLLKHLETHDMLPDARIESEKGEEYSYSLLHDNWDFLARWFLRKYYRA